ncbi:glycosyltransferase family 2 protein [Flavobacterium silvisoli]|uniref:Glycosyltransferase family 2 protein n=1 Tax=Flavobacterium silvisoli TaxID=2529433 RepID=A0A4V2L503_9FLAO|nr:glycosyltransferase family 2 protein [Flavobacterium silvisoli]TBX68738.1 glycosyltransferase family 2 protein [Flavobacterium silvisoli]
MPKFSVIIPLYNKEKFVAKTINSVLDQTFTDYEIIVINDGSTDNSERVILSFTDSRIHYFATHNHGASAARNTGIEKAGGDYICFLDADDYWYPDFLATMYHYSELFPEQKVFGAAIEIETSKKTIPAQYAIQRTGDFELVNFFKASVGESVLCTSSVAIHKDVFEAIGNFDISIKSGQDTDLWIRIGLLYPVLFVWKIQARYIFDPQSLSRNKQFLNVKINFSKFAVEEQTNEDLKIFLDLNRFALAIKSKLVGDKKSFNYYYGNICLEKLSFKKRIILLLPAFILKVLIKWQTLLVNIGWGKSVFR